MSVQAITWALEASTTAPEQKLVLLLLANYANADNDAPLDLERLALASEMTVAQTEAALTALEARQLIWRVVGSDGWTAHLNVPIRESGYVPELTKEERARALARLGRTCVGCGAKDRLEVDHIVPRSRGGRNDDANLQVLCRSCNASKGRKLVGSAS